MRNPLARTMSRRGGARWLLLPLALLLAGPRGCPEQPGTLYTLAAESLLVEGCIDGPCLCPVGATELLGSFRLAELPTLAPGPTRLFGVSDVDWTAGPTRIRGGGLYEQDPVTATQRMRLHLVVGDAPPADFDSGRVDVSVPFPELAVRLRRNGAGACYDVIFDLRARPLGALERRCRENADCDEGAFCRTPEGSCDGAGRCAGRPDACPLNVDPVCGCDGRLYNNACEAAAAGIAVASRGPCPGLHGAGRLAQ